MKRICGVQKATPGPVKVLPFASTPLTFNRIVTVQPTRSGLQVKQFRKRRPDNPITMVSKSQAKINVVKGDRQIDLIQSADFEEYRTPNCDAGAGHGQKCPRKCQLSEIAGIILGAEPA